MRFSEIGLCVGCRAKPHKVTASGVQAHLQRCRTHCSVNRDCRKESSADKES